MDWSSHRRKRIRLPHYDYSQGGYYFCTACVHAKHKSKNLLCKIENQQTRLNRFGHIVQERWEDIPNHHPTVVLDEFAVMPNHIHLILFLDGLELEDDFENKFGPQKSGSLGIVVGSFKSAVTKAVGEVRNEKTAVWQPRFYDHIVRSEAELQKIRAYIRNNPAAWQEDRCHPLHPHFESAWNGHNPDIL